MGGWERQVFGSRLCRVLQKRGEALQNARWAQMIFWLAESNRADKEVTSVEA